MLYPLTFHPIFKERVWGGRKLESLYRKQLPAGVPIGESWEITDRPEGTSVIANGPLAGKTLRWLMERHGDKLLGAAKPAVGGRFPLLVKILDAQEKLSLQVHPPPDKAARMGGEPKTEMWYIADAAPGADLFVGLKNGVTRAKFEREIQAGTVAKCFHRIAVKRGDAMFLPSGRVHALGAGNLIFEIQQNSDTTYRVFDWNRVGLDGKPRELHVAQALEAIDFQDFQPAKISRMGRGLKVPLKVKGLVASPLFNVDLHELSAGKSRPLTGSQLTVIGVVEGALKVVHNRKTTILSPGQFCLVPASLRKVTLIAACPAVCLLAMPK